MIQRWKIKIRFWLIALVREAIRLEQASCIKQDIASRKPVAVIPSATIPASKPATPVSEPSFERSEAEALAAQEKYYEPSQQ